jgi:magnesium chelatase family protein
MPLATVFARSRNGIDAPAVTVEVHIANGLPNLSIVGLPETAVKESKDRVRSAILNSHLEFPARRITVNMAPADVPKEGGRFDLAIALGILAASGQIKSNELDQYECLGELSLSGALRPFSGALPVAIQSARAGRRLILPQENAEEAALVENCEVLPAKHLLEVCAHINGLTPIAGLPAISTTTETQAAEATLDISDVRGHFQAKRALEIAAAGRHNLLMYGPPGTGKSMLATRLPGILPLQTQDEALESAAICSISNQPFAIHNWRIPPFRSPHHTASATAMVGGGSNPRPGEISLAHNGVLFLDELPEFERKVLEVLREPLESGCITISRAARQADFPARFQLLAAMNPCPCGYLGDPSARCHCTSEQVQRYRSRISGPLLDRIDMHIEVTRIAPEVLRANPVANEETSRNIRERVVAARNLAMEQRGTAGADLSPQQVKQFCKLDNNSQNLLEQAVTKLGLSHRAYHRILKVSRTIADLAQSATIEPQHISEAISYRKLDRVSLV